MERIQLSFMPHGQRSMLARMPGSLSPVMVQAVEQVRFEGPAELPETLRLLTREQMERLKQAVENPEVPEGLRPLMLLMREMAEPPRRWLRIPRFHAEAAGIERDAWLILTNAGELLIRAKTESE